MYQITVVHTTITQTYPTMLSALQDWKNLQSIGVDAAYIILNERTENGWTRVDVPRYLEGLARLFAPA